MAHSHNEIRVASLKECTLDICNGTNESQKYYIEQKKPGTKSAYVWLHFYETLENTNLIYSDRKQFSVFLEPGVRYKSKERWK